MSEDQIMGSADDMNNADNKANGDSENEDERKLFVGGLNWETSENDLKEYMSKYGTVDSCNLKKDIETGRSRGFGFVVFAEKDAIGKVLEIPEHKLHGNKIDPKRANPKGKNQEPPVKKIYVAKVSPTTTDDQIKEYFEQWGKVDKIEAPFDKEKDQRKNFVFVEFELEETVNKVLNHTTENPDYKHMLNNDEVEIKKATPSRSRGRGFFRGGRGGGRGGGYGYGGWNSYGPGGYGYDGYGGYGGYGGGYGGYDYSGYGGYGGWGGYDQSYYGGGGYDYSGWGGYGDQSGQQGNYGKAPKGGRGGGGYRPY